jgi:hypothetical protein
MTNPTIVRDDAAASYMESITTYQRHLDGEDVGLVETVDLGNGITAWHPLSREKATESFIRELRRYANYLERGHAGTIWAG